MVRQLTADVAGLARAIGTPPENEEDRPGEVWAWLLAEDSAPARADLPALVEWLGRGYLRYPRAPCGRRGAGVAARRLAWTAVADWHDRMRPGGAGG